MSEIINSIDNYINSSEKIIALQNQAITKLRETLEAKKVWENTIIEYLQAIYKGLQSKDLETRQDAMWHLENLAQRKEAK